MLKFIIISFWYHLSFCFLIYTVFMSKYYDYEKKIVKVLTYLHIFSPPDYEKVVSGILSFCTCICIVCPCEQLTTVWTVEQILFLFCVQEIILLRSVLDEYYDSSPKDRDL